MKLDIWAVLAQVALVAAISSATKVDILPDSQQSISGSPPTQSISFSKISRKTSVGASRLSKSSSSNLITGSPGIARGESVIRRKDSVILPVHIKATSLFRLKEGLLMDKFAEHLLKTFKTTLEEAKWDDLLKKANSNTKQGLLNYRNWVVNYLSRYLTQTCAPFCEIDITYPPTGHVLLTIKNINVSYYIKFMQDISARLFGDSKGIERALGIAFSAAPWYVPCRQEADNWEIMHVEDCPIEKWNPGKAKDDFDNEIRSAIQQQLKNARTKLLNSIQSKESVKSNDGLPVRHRSKTKFLEIDAIHTKEEALKLLSKGDVNEIRHYFESNSEVAEYDEPDGYNTIGASMHYKQWRQQKYTSRRPIGRKSAVVFPKAFYQMSFAENLAKLINFLKGDCELAKERCEKIKIYLLELVNDSAKHFDQALERKIPNNLRQLPFRGKPAQKLQSLAQEWMNQ